MRNMWRAFKYAKVGDKIIVLSPLVALTIAVAWLVVRIKKLKEELIEAYCHDNDEEDDPSLEDFEYEDAEDDQEDEADEAEKDKYECWDEYRGN